MTLLPSRRLDPEKLLTSRPAGWQHYDQFFDYLQGLSDQGSNVVLGIDDTIVDLLRSRPWGQDDALIQSLAPTILGSHQPEANRARAEVFLAWHQDEFLTDLVRRAGLAGARPPYTEETRDQLLELASEQDFAHYHQAVTYGLDVYAKNLLLVIGRLETNARRRLGQDEVSSARDHDILEQISILSIAIGNKVGDPDGLKYYLRSGFDSLISDLLHARSMPPAS
jgi:hypothetical protein